MNQNQNLLKLFGRLDRLIILFLYSFFCVGIIASHPGEAIAQGSRPASSTPGAPAGSYALSEFDSVNLFSGNLNVNLPLVGLRGRGGLDVGVSLAIDHQWTVQEGTRPEMGNYDYMISNQVFSRISGGGHVRVNGSIQQTNEVCNEHGPWYYFRHQLFITVVSSDGTEVKLVDPSSKGSVQNLLCNVTSINYGTVFRSTDGESITFISDSNVYSVDDYGALGFGVSGYLFANGGSKSRVDNGAIVWTQDKNGNRVEFEYDTSQTLPHQYPAPTKIKDSIGREILIAYGIEENSPYGRCNRITFKGTNGEDRVIKVSLGAVVRQTVQDTDDEFSISSMITTDPNVFPYVGGNIHDWSRLPKAVWLPDGRSYQFKYNNNGRIAEVTLPTGGRIEYDFYPSVLPFPNQYEYLLNRVKERRLYDESNNLENKTTFGFSFGSFNGFTTKVTVEKFDAQNNRLAKSDHYFIGEPNQTPRGWWNSTQGKEGRTEVFDIDGTTVLRRIETQWQPRISADCYDDVPTYNPCGLSPYPQVPNTAAIPVETKTTLVDSNQVSLISYINPATQALALDQFNNITDVWYYDYGVGQPGDLLKREHTNYLTDSNYTGHYLRSLPLQQWVSSDADGNNKVSLIQFEYDNYGSDANHSPLQHRSNVIGHASSFGQGFTIRGNITAVTRYANAQSQSGSVTSHNQYDILGNVVKTLDANGNATTIDYDDNFGAPDGEARTNTPPSQLNGLSTFAFPKSSTNALGWVTGYTQYDYFTGQPVNTEDLNGVISKAIYNDLLDRPTQTVTAIGTSFEMQSNVIYDDANRRIEAKSDLNALNDNLLKSESFYDGFGRTIEARRYEADGGYVTTKTEYDALGRAGRVTNPFRPLVNETVYWTETSYDSLGRITRVRTPDGAEILTSFSGNTVTVTDQAGKQRRSITNALGQLIRVDDPNDAGQLGAVSNPNQPTFYSYDTLNNLTTVNQGIQIRTFAYDSLSRLLSAANPESGTIGYQYDPNGNLTSKTDARSITTTYSYDALNRVTQRSYSGETGYTTPTVTYTYGTVAPAIGRLTKVENGISTTEYTEFDILGRVKAHKQTTDGQDYTTGYEYNLSGALIEQTYPSGRKVKSALDADGNLAQVHSRKSSSDIWRPYASNFVYTAAGAVSSMKLGNGRFENTAFNSRLQPTQIGLGSSATNQGLLKLNYYYGTTNNNGNVLSQTITVPIIGQSTGFVAMQTYSYDSLNRLKQATENITPNGGSQSLSWQQTYTFDRYGNRNFDEANTTTLPKECTESGNPVVCEAIRPIVNPSANAANNRLSSTGWQYDAAGNTTVDAEGRQFTYDAENKQVKVKDSQNQIVGEYFYSGDGLRIKKVVPGTGETTIFAYDASNRLVAEYSTVVEPAATAKTSYLTTDHLGSPRITTDQFGQVASRRDFMPYGEEIARQNYGADSIRQKFTTYERDGETGLDYAKARHFASGHGKFSSPDSFLNDSDPLDPSSWNLYVYVRNNPVNFVDPTGMFISTHVDEKGKVIAVFNDGDLGVYQHQNNADGKAPTEAQLKKRSKNKGTSSGGNRIGETYFWDEFVSPETGRTMTWVTIYPEGSFNPMIEENARKAKGMNLRQIQAKMGRGGDFDIKNDPQYKNAGMKLNGKFVTSRSAGNFQAGYLAQGGTYFGVSIDFTTFQKMAGYQAEMDRQGKTKSWTDMADIYLNGTEYGPAPYYGEIGYQYRMSVLGWEMSAAAGR